MHLGTFDSTTECYISLLDHVYNQPQYISSPRGQKIKEVIGVSFTITNPRDRIPYVIGRKFSVTYMIAELVWYLSGNNSTEWISNYSAFWSNISDDGTTANSAYGARLFKKHEKIAQGRFTQFQYVIDELHKDPDSRRAVMHLRVPDDSIDANLDVPCTLALQYFIRDNKLHQTVTMRSSDLIFGIAFDIPAFTVFQEIIANELGVEVGTYTHTSNSLHIYEKHFGMVEQILDNQNKELSLNLANTIGPMPELYGASNTIFSNIRELFDLELKLRQSLTKEELFHFLDSSNLAGQYLDWAKILAASRAKDLNLHDIKQEILDSIQFVGYKNFNWRTIATTTPDHI